MAADQDRAARVKALKQERPDLTWRRIADHVGVTERSATDWARKGGIDYDNAKKLAEIFEVDVDYIWRGTDSTSEQTPSPFAGADNVQDQLEALNAKLDRVLHNQQRILTLAENNAGRIDELERAIKEETSELLPGVRELLHLAGEQEPPRARDKTARRAS